MSLTAFAVIIGSSPSGESLDEAGTALDAFLTKLAEQPTYAHDLPGARLWQASVYPDESEVAVFRHRERHPQDGREHDRMIVFDGWIENRDEIVASLQHRGIKDSSCDSEIVLAGYAEWGYDVAHQLYGEYSFVVLDHEQGQPTPLVCAVRDKVGIRPLFYSPWKGGVAISNFPGALSVISWVGAEINEGYAAEYLCDEVNSFRETVYKNVSRILGGERCVYIGGFTPQCLRYWHPETQVLATSPELARGDLYDKVCRVTASACRSRGTVGLLVSGGIDSSCLAVATSDLIARGVLLFDKVHGIAIAHPGRKCDEENFQTALGSKVGFPIRRMSPLYPTVLDFAKRTQRTRYFYGPFASTPTIVGADLVRAMHGRVLINGEGGDEMLIPYARALCGALWKGKELSAVVRFLKLRWQFSPTSMGRLGKFRYLFAPFLGARAHNFLSRLRDRARRRWKPPVDDVWAVECDLLGRLDRATPKSRARTLSLVLSSSGYWSVTSESGYFFYFLLGVEARSPLKSATLIEAANRLPFSLLDGQSIFSRKLLRDAFSHGLPSIIRDRTDKAEFTEAILPEVKAMLSSDLFAARPQTPEYGERFSTLHLPTHRHVWQADALLAFRALRNVVAWK